MQTTTQADTTPADAAQAITAMRKRLSRWELDHLRAHCAELAQRLDAANTRIDTLESEVWRAWDAADSWRGDAVDLATHLQAEGAAVGLTVDGALVVMPQEDAATAATQAVTNALANAFPPIVGTHLPNEGGTLGAIIARRNGSTYGLIVADALHEITGTWGSCDKDVPGATNTDGAANTLARADAGSQTAQAVRSLVIDGHADWFIGSRLEMRLLAELAPKLFDQEHYYLTSSQHSRYYAWVQHFECGYSYYGGSKEGEFRVRPVRSIQLQPFTPSTLVAACDSREILGTLAGKVAS